MASHICVREKPWTRAEASLSNSISSVVVIKASEWFARPAAPRERS